MGELDHPPLRRDVNSIEGGFRGQDKRVCYCKVEAAYGSSKDYGRSRVFGIVFLVGTAGGVLLIRRASQNSQNLAKKTR